MARESMTNKSTKRKVKKIRGENEPKKPTTEYFMFLRDERKSLKPGLSVKEQTQILSQKWAQLSPEAKSEYSKEYAVAYETYKKELEAYKKTDEYEEILKKNKELMLNGKSGKQISRKPSGYNLFVKEERAKLMSERGDAPAPSFKEISQLISQKWQALEEKEKEAYKEKATHNSA